MNASSVLSLSSLSRFVYTHNPFYLISALLVLFGLHRGLAGDNSLTGGWLLMGCLCGYTLLLALTGYAIIRWGQIWEDARMILLVLVLLFLALSVSFDKLVLDNPASGARLLMLGLSFSLLVSEGVFRSLDIRLAAKYRLPFYLVLGLLFAYPAALGHLSVAGYDKTMAWSVFLFPAVAAAAWLTLWPAARSVGRHEPANGTPWPWPWFPWSLFLFLELAIGLRSYSLSMAFEVSKGSNVSFAPYFLVPLLLATALLLLEMGLANDSRRLQGVALGLPLLALLMSLPGTALNPVAMHFLNTLIASVGSPAQLTLAALSLFYAWSWWRGMGWGEAGLIASAAMASMVGPYSINLASLTSPQPLPLAAIATLELAVGLWRGTSWRVLTALAAGSFALGASRWAANLSSQERFALWHLSALGLLLIAGIYNDRWARNFRLLATATLPLFAWVVATSYEFIFPEISRGAQAALIAGLCAVGGCYWYRTAGMFQILSLLLSTSALGVVSLRGLYLALAASRLEKGRGWLAAGLLAFAIATLLSVIKAGGVGRGWLWVCALNAATRDKPSNSA